MYTRIKHLWLLGILLFCASSPEMVARQAPPTEETTISEDAFSRIIEVLSFKNTEIKDVLRGMATKYNANILVADDVQQRLTLHLVDVTVGDALDFIVADNGLQLEKFGNIYKISNKPPPAPAPKTWNASFEDNLLSADFREDNIREALHYVATISDQTILLDRDISGSISGRINAIAFEDGLFQLLQANGYRLRKRNNAYLVQRMRNTVTTERKGGGSQKSSLWINAHQNKIDFEATDVALKPFLDELAAQTDINIFLMGEPKGSINARANGLSLEECLNYILLEHDFTYKKSGDIYLIGDKSNKGLTSSRLVRLNNLKADGILEMLPKKSVQKAELSIIKEHNALLINGAQDVLSEIEDIIQRLDKPIPQIFLEVLVIDYRLNDTHEFGIEAGIGEPSSRDSSSSLLGSLTGLIPGIDLFRTGGEINNFLKKNKPFEGFNIGKLPDDFYLTVHALDQVDKLNIRSKPQLTTLNGHEAELVIGETRYFKLISQTPFYEEAGQGYTPRTTNERFQTIDINTSLKITPWVSASGEITIEINPEFNAAGDDAVAGELPPNIRRRALSSTVRLHDGETIVLGGLIEERDIESSSQVPLLGRIPVLGRLFKNSIKRKEKNELIIYVTPHLSYSDNWMIPG